MTRAALIEYLGSAVVLALIIATLYAALLFLGSSMPETGA